MKQTIALLFVTSWLLNGQVRINEILFVPDPASDDARRTHQWVELVNAGKESANLGGFTLAGRTGRSGDVARRLPSVDLPAGAHLVVHFAVGENKLDFAQGSGDFYTGEPPRALPFNPESDEVALYSAQAIVDFMSWASNTAPYRPGTAHNDAVAAGIWKANAFLNRDHIAYTPWERYGYVKPGISIGRAPNSTDNNQPLDFYSGGGVSAHDISPGRRNYDPLPIFQTTYDDSEAANAKAPRRAEPTKEWTVMMYLMGDDPTLTQQLMANIIETSQAINRLSSSEKAKVNFVVYFDWLKMGDSLVLNPSTGLFESRVSVVDNGTAFGRIAGFDPAQGAHLELPARSANHPDVRFLSQENNSADGDTLTRFIRITRDFYPARKYALIIGSHGAGWKGLGRDIMSPGARDYDRLYVTELQTAVFVVYPEETAEFELVVFDACLMASVEVGRELDFARYMVASEDTIPGGGIAYGSLVRSLAENSEENGESIGRRMLRHYRDRYSEGPEARADRPNTLSVIDVKQVFTLTARINAWARWLVQVTPLIGAKIEDPTDNIQLFIRKHATEAQRFSDNNFVDLRDFAERVRNDAQIPGCESDRGGAMLEQLAKTVLQETHDEKFPGAYGLHIHFPLHRTFPGRLTPELELFAPAEPYDFPTTRHHSGSNPYGAYSINRGKLPLASRDQEDGTPFAAFEWPSKQVGLNFNQFTTSYSEFLDLYYHPVAAARIIRSTMPDKSPTVNNRGACGNAYHGIVVPVGATVLLDAIGSTDADMPPNTPSSPRYFRWDLKPEKECEGTCLSPTELVDAPKDDLDAATGVDAIAVATDNIDQNIFMPDAPNDDRDASTSATEKKCEEPGVFIVRLMVFDDNHLFPFHNAKPSGRYLHYQSGAHFAIIECTPAGTAVTATTPTPYVQVDDKVLIGVGGGAPGTGTLPKQQLRVGTGEGTRSFTANGTAIPPGTEQTVDSNERGEMRIEFIAGDPPATAPRSAIRSADSGTAQFTVMPPGGSRAPFRIPYVPRLAPLPTRMIVTPPTGTLTVGTEYQITLEAQIDGRPLGDAVFTLQSLPGGVQFVNGTLFNSNRSTQVRAGATGRLAVRFIPLSPGPLEIDVLCGQLRETLRLPVTGPDEPPTYIDVTGVPQLIQIDEEATATIGIFSRLRQMPNTQVLIELMGGQVTASGSTAPFQRTTLTTNAQGQIQWKFKTADPSPVRLKISIPGTTLNTIVWIAVQI